MSDFLSRLVQRTRGEAATVRPAFHPVTAPDPGAPAWDERISVREAPQLARTPQRTPLEARATSSARVTSTLSPGQASHEVLRGNEQPVALAPQASVAEPAPVPVASIALASQAVTERAAAALEAAGSVELARAAAAAVHVQSSFVAARPMPATALLSAAQATGDQAAIEPGVRAAPRSVPATAFEPAPALRAAHPVLALAPAAPRAQRAEVRAQSVSRPHAAQPAAALHEHNTTVEVSIGRIEVRLPPRAHGAGADASALPARRAPALGLDEYLERRNTRKSP